MTRTLRAVSGGGIDSDPLPHNITAEQAVLGAAMLAPAALAEARAVLDGSEFYRPAHQTVWQAICALADRGDPHDPLSVGAHLGTAGMAKVGGAPYLHTLIAAVPAAANAAYYAHIVRDLAYARTVIEAASRLAQHAWAATGDAAADLRGKVAAEAAALAEADRRGWPEPLPLSSTPDLPPFPLWALPEWLGEYAACLAEVTQTPADLAGCLALAVIAVAASGKVWVAPTGDPDGWREPTCLYIVVALPPGNRKSEVFRAMTVPLRAVERTMIDAARPLIAEALVRREIAEAEADRTAKAAVQATAKAAGNDAADPAAAITSATDARITLDAAQVPAEPRLFTADATPEALGSLLADQGGRFAVLSAEGELFAIAAGRYSGDPNLGILKEAHAGEATRVDRKGRPAEHIDAATLTIGICTQPGVLDRLGDTPEFREQGFLARFLYSVPESLLGYRNHTPAPMPPAARDLYNATVTALTLSLSALDGTQTLSFAPDAAQAVTALLAAIEPRFRADTNPPGDLAHMTDWGGKLAGAIIRIAALLHLAEHVRDGWDRPVSLATLNAATEIGEYFTQHAKAAYDAIGADPATVTARAVLQWLSTTRATQVTARDLARSLKKKTSDFTAPLAILESHGWIRQRPRPRPGPGGGNPGAPVWDVHPALVSQS